VDSGRVDGGSYRGPFSVYKYIAGAAASTGRSQNDSNKQTGDGRRDSRLQRITWIRGERERETRDWACQMYVFVVAVSSINKYTWSRG